MKMSSRLNPRPAINFSLFDSTIYLHPIVEIISVKNLAFSCECIISIKRWRRAPWHRGRYYSRCGFKNLEYIFFLLSKTYSFYGKYVL